MRAAAVDTVEQPLETNAATGIIGYRLRRAQLGVFQRFNAAFAELNLRPVEFSVLALIADNPGRKQTEIAEVLGIRRANFVALINGLEQRGLTVRRAAHGDKRANALHLTPAGTQFLEEVRKLHDAFENECIRRIGGSNARDTLLKLLDELA